MQAVSSHMHSIPLYQLFTKKHAGSISAVEPSLLHYLNLAAYCRLDDLESYTRAFLDYTR